MLAYSALLSLAPSATHFNEGTHLARRLCASAKASAGPRPDASTAAGPPVTCHKRAPQRTSEQRSISGQRWQCPDLAPLPPATPAQPHTAEVRSSLDTCFHFTPNVIFRTYRILVRGLLWRVSCPVIVTVSSDVHTTSVLGRTLIMLA